MREMVFRALAPAGALVLLAAGCGGGAAPTATRVSQPTATRPAAAPTATPTKAPVAPAARKGTLVIASSDLGRELVRPYVAQSGSDIPHAWPMYSSQFNVDERGNLIGETVESWKLLEPAILQLNIRKGIKFQNGDALTADDVKFSIEKMTAPGGWGAGAMGPSLGSVEKVDDYTLKLHFKNPFPLYGQQMSLYYGMIVPKKYLEQVGEEAFDKAPIGAGPFKLVKRALGDRWEYEAFDGYFGEGPYLEKLVLRIIPEDSTRMAGLKTGELDIITGVGGMAQLSEIKTNPNIRALEIPGGGRSYAGFHDTSSNPNSPFFDVRVRRAANLAINKDAICNKLWGGHCVPEIMHSTSGSWAKFAFEDPEIKLPPYDPARAKQLLAEAGYPNGFNTTMITAPHPNIPEKQEMEQLMAAYLGAVGIRVELKPVEWGVAVGKFFRGELDGIGVYGGATWEDPRMTSHIVARETHPQAYTTYSNRFDDGVLEQWKREVDRETDEAKAKELWKKMMKRSLEYAVYIEMPSPSSFYGVRNRVNDWKRPLTRPYLQHYQYMSVKD